MLETKEPIVSTFGAHALRSSPAEVLDSYDWHAATFVEPVEISSLRSGFIQAVKESRTPKACLVAPFGYGKTASAIGVWRACRSARLLAVPPVSCGSFSDIARAVCDWLLFALPEQSGEIASARDSFLASSAEALARRDEHEFGIPYEQALASISDKLVRGYLDFEDVSISLISFLERATSLALAAGYGGLVVIIDEVQQLLGNANKGVLVALRQLIWGLRTRKLPLGVLVTMDPDTERILSDRAGDILHRIKDDGLYIDIRHVYGRDFPARLWDQYCTTLRLSLDERSIIDRSALEALGQLCERDDLSNGPRTVISVLQVAVTRRYELTRQSYSPISLVDDLVSGLVRFAGDRGILPSVIAELLNFPYFQKSPDRTQVLKLIAAFPRGCPEDIAAAYGLDPAWRDLRDDLRGEILTELDEGLALIETQRVGRPANRLNVLLRRYWMQITDHQLMVEDTPRVFSEIALPLLFASKLHDLSGWARQEEVQLSASGDYEGLLEGTFSPQYPLRRVFVSIRGAGGEAINTQVPTDIDFAILFRLSLDDKSPPRVQVSPNLDLIEFDLVLRRPSDVGLRGGLKWIEHYLSPHPISAAIVLSLLSYLASYPEDNLSSQDAARTEDTLARLREWLLAELLPPQVFRDAGFDVAQAGRGGLQELLFLISSRRWPAYRTLATHQHWTALLQPYEAALEKIPPAARVGTVPVVGKKDEIARLLGQARHAGFESRMKQYGDLLSLEAWTGNVASIRFLAHASELQLAARLRSVGSVGVGDAHLELRHSGFCAPEARLLLRLANARGLIALDGETVSPLAVPSVTELSAKLRSLKSRAKALPEASVGVLPELETITVRLQQGALDQQETSWRLDSIEEDIAKAEREASESLRLGQQRSRSQLMESMSQLSPVPPSGDCGALTNHLKALGTLLDSDRQRLARKAHGILECWPPAVLGEVTELCEQIVAWSNRVGFYRRWVALAEQISDFQNAIARLEAPDETLRRLAVSLDHLIRDARKVLAEIGASGSAEVGRFEVSLHDIQQSFQACGEERGRAYASVAVRLSKELTSLVGTASVALPEYDPSSDQMSFEALSKNAASAVSRSLALMILHVIGESGSKQAKLSRVKLRADLGSLALRASDPAWLLSRAPIRVRPEAAKAIRAICQRVDREATDDQSSKPLAVTAHLTKTLLALPPGAVEVTSILKSANGSTSAADLLAELARLHGAGVVRLTVELISPTPLEGQQS